MKHLRIFAVAGLSLTALVLLTFAVRFHSTVPRFGTGLKVAQPADLQVRPPSPPASVARPASVRAAVFTDFADWCERYANATEEARAILEQEGIALAQQRREALKALMESDPEQVLKLAVADRVRRTLPASIVKWMEERVGGRGELAVLAALPEPGKEAEVTPVFRTATIGGREYHAFVYGRRLGEPTRRNIPLHGLAIDDHFAIDASPLRALEPGEAAEAVTALAGEAICGVSGLPATSNGEPTPVEVGGEILVLCGTNHVEAMAGQLTAAEGGGPTGGETGPEVQASAWTEGMKRVLLIRVDFPDLTGLSLTDAGGATLIANLHSFYTEMSYGRTGYELVGAGSDVTPILRMTNSASWYGANNYYNQLRSEARAAAAAAGYVLSNYELDVTCMGDVPGFAWSGLAYVGAAGAWLRNSFGTGVAGHELGHNYGLNHAAYWDTAGQSVIGPGTSVEYGDSFDTMGAASAGANHFNARYKSYLNWLQTNDTLRVTASGTYRIYAHDSQTATGLRGLSVAMDSQTNYWVEFRQKFTANKWLMNGASLRWAQGGNQRSQLLDTTPGSQDLKNDAAIVIGRTYSDFAAGVHITPIGKGGTVPESLDVVMNLGSFPGNISPALTVNAPATTASTGVALNFTASAADANGDVLAYFWDFGDGNFGTNGAAATKSWSTAGDYVVRCTVSDMKGGTASDSVIVRIGSPTVYRISGVVLNGTAPLAGVRVSVSSTRMTYTDSDGTYTIVNLSAGSYTVSASLYPYTLAATGFSNPLTVGPDRTGVNFASSTITPPAIVSQPASQSVNLGANVTFTVVATGTAPLTYQWRFNGANISGATNASYTRSNVQSGDAGNYSVVVANAAGSATSADAALSINTPPTIVSQPQSQSVIAGAGVSFTVAASGSTPLSYQWRLNGTNLPGATAATYSVPNAQAAHAGSYLAVVNNSLGAATSAVANLTVNYTLTAVTTAGGTVAKSPNAASYAVGSSVTITATSTSSFPFSAWSGDASSSVNPLTVTVTTNMVITANFASPVADVIVDNPAGVFTGTWSSSTIAADKYGADFRLAGGTTATPSATATFNPNVITAGRYDVYLWSPTISRPAGAVPVVISSASGTQNLTVAQNAGAGTWQLLASEISFAAGASGYVRIANNVGQGGKDVAADAVRLAYSPNQGVSAPAITSHPTSVTFNPGGTLQFNVTATGTAPLTYQWRFNGANVVNATNASLQLANAGSGQAGNYLVVVTNASGAATSRVAVATLNVAPVATITSPANGAVLAAPATFSITATASDADGSVTQVEFYNGGVLVSADTSSPYSASVSSLAAGGYTLAAVATDSFGARSTNSVGITVNAAPTVALSSPSTGGSFFAPTNLTLAATASDSDGTVTKVEFFQGGTKLGEDLTSPYAFAWNSVTAGAYALTARATDNQGVVSTSAVVNITVGNNVAPSVAITSPANGAVLNAPAAFSITATASDADGSVTQVEFYNGGVLVSADTSSPYSASVSSLAAGGYTLAAVATDSFGARSTNSVGIIVNSTTKKTNTLARKKGTYDGLYYESLAIVQESSGSFSLATTDKGSYSGYLISEGKKRSFSGQFDLDGQATNQVPRRDTNALTLQLTLVSTNGSDQVSGSVSDGRWVAELWGGRAAFHTSTNPTAFVGTYNFVIPGSEDVFAAPGGHGYGTTRVAAGGRVILGGTLGDGYRIARSANMSVEGLWPLHAPLHHGAGSILGWVAFTNRISDDFHGTLSWIKSANAAHPRYPRGFTNETAILASRYTRPVTSTNAIMAFSDAVFVCEGGDLTGVLTNHVWLAPDHRVLAVDGRSLGGAISPRTGLFKGVTIDGVTGRSTRYQGALLQKGSFGAGMFYGTNLTGRVMLAPALESAGLD